MGYDLPIHRANAYQTFQEWRQDLLSETPTFDRTLRMCTAIRRVGICSLFMDADSESFNLCLHVSGRAFAHFLNDIPPDDQATGLATPFLDAIACNDFDGAGLIAQRASKAWNRNREYEEDFVFMKFLFELFFGAADASVCQALLDSYEAIIAGEPDPRLDMANALLKRDADGFVEALSDLTDRHQEQYRQVQNAGAMPDEQALTEGKLFVEGLAHIRLAERLGMPTAKNYRLIPSNGRADFSAAFTPTLWRQF